MGLVWVHCLGRQYTMRSCRLFGLVVSVILLSLQRIIWNTSFVECQISQEILRWQFFFPVRSVSPWYGLSRSPISDLRFEITPPAPRTKTQWFHTYSLARILHWWSCCGIAFLFLYLPQNFFSLRQSPCLGYIRIKRGHRPLWVYTSKNLRMKPFLFPTNSNGVHFMSPALMTSTKDDTKSDSSPQFTR
jgi:hypothetical protein